MKIKLDENFSPRVVRIFREAGCTADTVLEERLSGASDDAIYDAIVAERRCLVTFDLDFSDIIRYPAGPTAGIVVIRPSRPLSLSIIEQFARQLTVEFTKRDPSGCLWILEPNRLRIRKPQD